MASPPRGEEEEVIKGRVVDGEEELKGRGRRVKREGLNGGGKLKGKG